MRSNQEEVSRTNQNLGNSTNLLSAQRAHTQTGKPKPLALRWIAGLAFAGALAFVAPHQAQAQLAVGVRVGGYSGYVAPAYGYGYANPYAVQAWEQRRAYDEHAQWEAERAAQWQREHWDHEREERFHSGDYARDGHWDRGNHVRGW